MARGEDEWSFYVQDASSSLNSLSLIKPLGSWTLEDFNDYFFILKKQPKKVGSRYICMFILLLFDVKLCVFRNAVASSAVGHNCLSLGNFGKWPVFI